MLRGYQHTLKQLNYGMILNRSKRIKSNCSGRALNAIVDVFTVLKNNRN